jgi:hypothetical protein
MRFFWRGRSHGTASGVDGARAILAGRDWDATGGPDDDTYLQSETRQESIQILHELNPCELC